MLVTLAYVVVQGLLFVAKFVAYDRWVFTDGGGVRAALRARRTLAGHRSGQRPNQTRRREAARLSG